MNAWKPILAALVIFAAGVITGGLTVNLRRLTSGGAGPAMNRSARLDRLDPPLPARAWNPQVAETQLRDLSQRISRYLSLTPEQREQIQAILKASQGRMRTLAEEIAPQTREELRHMREQIRQQLTPEQRRRFEEMFRNRDNRPRRADAPPS